MLPVPSLIVLFIAAFMAGTINVLAGGGAFLTFPAMLLTGLDPRMANISSTIGLFPMQATAGFAGRKLAGSTDSLSFRTLVLINLVGGVIGARLLLFTPPAFFAHLVPWLVLFATLVFAWGSFSKRPAVAGAAPRLGRVGLILSQITISIYVGYYGGGGGFMMLAALTLAGLPIRKANANKMILNACTNAMAVAVFLFAKNIGWPQVAITLIGSELGAHLVGVRLLHKVDERVLRLIVVGLGAALTIGLFIWL